MFLYKIALQFSKCSPPAVINWMYLVSGFSTCAAGGFFYCMYIQPICQIGPQKLVLRFLIEKIIIYNEKNSDPKNIKNSWRYSNLKNRDIWQEIKQILATIWYRVGSGLLTRSGYQIVARICLISCQIYRFFRFEYLQEFLIFFGSDFFSL